MNQNSIYDTLNLRIDHFDGQFVVHFGFEILRGSVISEYAFEDVPDPCVRQRSRGEIGARRRICLQANPNGVLPVCTVKFSA